MINYNIRKIIIDKVAINKWKNKVKNINQEYMNVYYIDNYDNFMAIIDEIKSRYVWIYENRKYVYPKSLSIDKRTGYVIFPSQDTVSISKRYLYTSGKNYSRGYK